MMDYHAYQKIYTKNECMDIDNYNCYAHLFTLYKRNDPDILKADTWKLIYPVDCINFLDNETLEERFDIATKFCKDIRDRFDYGIQVTLEEHTHTRFIGNRLCLTFTFPLNKYTCHELTFVLILIRPLYECRNVYLIYELYKRSFDGYMIHNLIDVYLTESTLLHSGHYLFLMYNQYSKLKKIRSDIDIINFIKSLDKFDNTTETQLKTYICAES